MEEVVLWAQLTSVQATGSCTTFLSFGFLTCEMGSQHHSWIKRASMGRSALQMDHTRVSTYCPPEHSLAHSGCCATARLFSPKLAGST